MVDLPDKAAGMLAAGMISGMAVSASAELIHNVGKKALILAFVTAVCSRDGAGLVAFELRRWNPRRLSR